MSEDANLALVRRVFEAWAAGDFTDIGWADPRIEFVGEGPGFGGVGPAAGLHRGIEAMTRAFRGWLNAFEDFGTEPISFEAKGDAVFTEVRFRGRGKGSGMPLETLRGANVFVIRDGLVVRLELHIDIERARRSFLDQT